MSLNQLACTLPALPHAAVAPNSYYHSDYSLANDTLLLFLFDFQLEKQEALPVALGMYNPRQGRNTTLVVSQSFRVLQKLKRWKYGLFFGRSGKTCKFLHLLEGPLS